MWLNGDGFYLGEEKRERNCATGRHRSGEKNCSNFLVQPPLSLFNRQFFHAEMKKKKKKN